MAHQSRVKMTKIELNIILKYYWTASHKISPKNTQKFEILKKIGIFWNKIFHFYKKLSFFILKFHSNEILVFSPNILNLQENLDIQGNLMRKSKFSKKVIILLAKLM